MSEPIVDPSEPRHVPANDSRAVLVAWVETADEPRVDLGGWTEADPDAFRAWAIGQILGQVAAAEPFPGREWRLFIAARATPQARDPVDQSP